MASTIADLRKIYPEFDEYNYTDEQVVRWANQRISEPLEATAERYGYDLPSSDTGKALAKGVSGWKEGYAHVANALDYPTGDYIRRQQQRQQMLSDTSTAPQTWDDAEGISGVAEYAWTKGVESLPYMAEYGVGALTGGATLGARIARGGLKSSMAAGPRTAAQVAKDAAMISRARQTGATIGGVAASYPSALGDVLGNQYDQSGSYDLLGAAALAAPYAAANAIGLEGLATRAATTGLRTGLTGSRAANAAIMGGTTMATEAGSETFQEVMNQYGRTQVDPSYDPYGDEAMAAYKESAIAGGLLGLVPGAVGGTVQRTAPKPVDPTGQQSTSLLDGANQTEQGQQLQDVQTSLDQLDQQQLADSLPVDQPVEETPTPIVPKYEPIKVDGQKKNQTSYVVSVPEVGKVTATITRGYNSGKVTGPVVLTDAEGNRIERKTRLSKDTRENASNEEVLSGLGFKPVMVAPQNTAQTTEQAPTPENVQAALNVFEDMTDEQIAAEAEAADKSMGIESKPLEAAVSSAIKKAAGKVTATAGELKGIVRKLLTPADIKPVVYNDKGPGINVEATRNNQEKLQGIHDAFIAFTSAAQAYASANNNAINTTSGAERTPRNTAEGEVFEEDAAASANKSLKTIADARSELDTAVSNLVRAAGSAANVDAIISTLKSKVQGKTSWTIDIKKNAPLLELMKKQGKSTMEMERALDTLISSTWNRYKQGDIAVGKEEGDVVRGTETRKSKEQQKRDAKSKSKGLDTKDTQLVKSVEEGETRQYDQSGRAKQGQGEGVAKDETAEQFEARKAQKKAAYEASKKKGIRGALAYLRRTGSAMEAAIAKAVDTAMARDGAPETRWTKDGENPNYDPVTNTIAIDKNASPEQILHEALHGALQWFVYSKPNHPAVKRLGTALDSLLKFYNDPAKMDKVGLSEQERSDVTDVMNVLNTLNGKGTTEGRLDAILELVSYGNTMRSFKKVLKAAEGAKSKGAQSRAWYQKLGSVFRHIVKLTQRLLGVTNTLANDVLDNSLELLLDTKARELAKASKPTALVPSKLEQGGVAAATKIERNIVEDHYKGHVIPQWVSSQFLFDFAGWGKFEKWARKKGSTLAEAIRKEAPGFAGHISKIAARFNVSDQVSKLMERYKTDRHVGYQLMEILADKLERSPAARQQAIMDYLDGDKKALDGQDDVLALSRLADSVLELFEEYKTALNEKDSAYFENNKLSESLLFATKAKNVASRTFGQRKMSEIIGTQRAVEEDITAFEDLMKRPGEENEDVDFENGRFYRIYDVKNGKRKPAGFISVEKAESMSYPADIEISSAEGKWRFDSKNKQGYVFKANMTAKEAIASQKSKDLSFALKNTMAALSGMYASKNFSNNISVHGYENGKPTASAVVFEDLDAALEAWGMNEEGKEALRERQKVIDGSLDESKTPTIMNEMRNYNVWVKVPPSAAFGDLSGKTIHGPVWAAMNDMSNRDGIIKSRVYSDSLRWFKKSKTIYNLGTHMTNVASNVTLSMLHDIPMGTLYQAAKLFATYEVNPKSLSKEDVALVDAFMKSGALLGNFSSAEVKKAIMQSMARQLETGDSFLSNRIHSFMGYEKGKSDAIAKLQAAAKKAGETAERIDQIATQTYAAEDNIFRLAAFIKTMQENGGDVEASGRFARTAFLDYDIDSVAVRAARETVIPFISWTYAITPVLGRIALTQPWKIANVFTAYAMLGAIAEGLAGDDDEEQRKRGPEYLREHLFNLPFLPYSHVRVPFIGDSQNPVYFRLGDYIPLHSTLHDTPTGFLGIPGFPQGLTPSNPFLSAAIISLMHVDPYTGKDLLEPTDTGLEGFGKVLRKLTDIGLPSMASSYSQDKFVDYFEGNRNLYTDKTVSTIAIARVLGLKMYDHNVNDQAALNVALAKKVEREYRDAINKAMKESARSGSPDPEALDREIRDLYERMAEEINKVYGIEN